MKKNRPKHLPSAGSRGGGDHQQGSSSGEDAQLGLGGHEAAVANVRIRCVECNMVQVAPISRAYD